MHVIDQLIDGIVTKLSGQTIALNKVYADNDGDFERENVPYIEVVYDSDSASDEGGYLGVQARDVHIDLRIVAKSDTARRTVMNIRAQVEMLLPGCTVVIDGREFPCVLNDVDYDPDDEADKPSRELTMSYQFLVIYPTGEPETFA